MRFLFGRFKGKRLAACLGYGGIFVAILASLFGMVVEVKSGLSRTRLAIPSLDESMEDVSFENAGFELYDTDVQLWRNANLANGVVVLIDPLNVKEGTVTSVGLKLSRRFQSSKEMAVLIFDNHASAVAVIKAGGDVISEGRKNPHCLGVATHYGVELRDKSFIAY